MRLADAITEADVAAFFRENGELIRAARERKAKAGETSGPLPLGYLYERERLKGKVVLDPEKAPLVRQAFVMSAAGYPIRKIIREATALGLTSIHGKPLGPSSLLRILHNPFYVGLIRREGSYILGNHPPLVDWQISKLAQGGTVGKQTKPAFSSLRTLDSRCERPERFEPAT